MKTKTAPIIILGMHRTGTSMLTRMLERLGLFCGVQKQGDHEAVFFLRLNDWALSQAGSRWDYPRTIDSLLENPEVRALTLEHLRFSMTSPRRLSYLGLWKTLRYPSIGELDTPWAWKDPRNTFTLPLWLELFPEARLVHAHRHGVDVAASLRTRHRAIVAARARRYRERRWLYHFRENRSAFTTSLRCASLDAGYALWEEYMAASQHWLQALPNPQIEVRYEDFLADPAAELKRVAEFCKLQPTADVLGDAAAQGRASRAYAYMRNAELQAFARGQAASLERFCYRADSEAAVRTGTEPPVALERSPRANIPLTS